MKFGKFLLAAALMVSGLAANAQETEKVEFNHHWFMQFQGGATYTLGKAGFENLISPAAQVAVGYQFTPVWALRLAVNGWQNKAGEVDGLNMYKWNYVAPALDVKFNLINACCKQTYNPKRVFGLNIIAGVGANIGWNNTDACAPAFEYYWDGTKVRPVGRVGLDFDFRCSKRISINIEAMSNFLSDKYNSQNSGKLDWYFSAFLGLKVGLGKVENVIPVIVPVVEEPAPAPVVKKEEPKPAPVVKKAPEMQTEIFYQINKFLITEGEQPKVENLINFLKANPETKVAVTGYADVETGNPRYNMALSQKRADNVAKTLVEAGIAAERITVDAKGDTVQPFAENDKNRVSICIAK